jgi:hypothetical protein
LAGSPGDLRQFASMIRRVLLPWLLEMWLLPDDRIERILKS